MPAAVIFHRGAVFDRTDALSVEGWNNYLEVSSLCFLLDSDPIVLAGCGPDLA